MAQAQATTSKRSAQGKPAAVNVKAEYPKLADLKRAFMAGKVTAAFYAAHEGEYAPAAQVPTATAIDEGEVFGKSETLASTHMVELAGIGSRPVRHSDAVWKAIFAAQELVEAQFE